MLGGAVYDAVQNAPAPDAPDGVPAERVIEHAVREGNVPRRAAQCALEHLETDGVVYRVGDRFKETNR